MFLIIDWVKWKKQLIIKGLSLNKFSEVKAFLSDLLKSMLTIFGSNPKKVFKYFKAWKILL